MKLLVTGGNGFIGSHFILEMINQGHYILNIDKSGNNTTIKQRLNKNVIKNYYFCKSNIIDIDKHQKLIDEFNPEAVVHFAAETHVDISIVDPELFIKSNIFGTFSLLEFFRKRNSHKKIKFIHISTDEVYGSIDEDVIFTEETNYNPSSPYSASKAAADHICKSWFKTYGLPTINTHCTNNFGPYQTTYKFIPKVIECIYLNKHIPVYGHGKHERDWLYVSDHVDGIKNVLIKGKPGETYNIGSQNVIDNLSLVKNICKIMDAKLKRVDGSERLIRFVEDRPGHDFKYSIDPSFIHNELDWKAKTTFEDALNITIDWYINNIN